MKKLKYNPFLMWESYAGAVINFILTSFSLAYFNLYYVNIWQKFLNLPSSGYSVLILSPIFGFLAGWGIHVLIRKLTKGKI